MSAFQIVLSLLTQLSLLVTCTFLFGVLKPFLRRLHPRSNDLAQGCLFGIFAIIVMLDPIQVADGVLFDLRGVIIVVAGALGGVIPAAVACLFVIIYRFTLGGVGAPLAIGSAITCAVLGIGFYLSMKWRPQPLQIMLVFLGIAAALQSLAWTLLLPAEIARQVMAATVLPILLVCPASTWILGLLLSYQERHLELEESLSHERNMLRILIDNVPDYIFIKDKTKHYILSNVAHARAAGVSTPSELLGRAADRFFPADYVTQHDTDDETVLLGESIIDQERQTVGENGTDIWVSTTKVPLLDAHGDVTGIVGISRNINERKQAEEALQRERNLLRTLIDAFPGNVYIKDAQSRFIDANAETIRKFGVKTPNDLLGKTDFDFFTPELAARYFADDQTVIQSGQPLLNIEEPTVDHGTRQNLWFLTTKAPIHNEQGEVRGLVGIGFDITGRKEAEQALQAKNEEERRFQNSLKALYEITIELTKIDQLDYFYRRAVELALERLGFDRFGLLLYDAEHSNVIGTYGTDAAGKLAAEHHLRFDPAILTGILKRTLETPDRFAFDERAELFSNLEPIGFGWNAAATLWNGEQSLGWVTADNGVQHQPVSKQLLDTLALYAQTVGTLLGRKRAEVALRENEAKLQTFFEVLPVGLAILNGEEQIVEMNPALERILDISLEGLLSGEYRARKYIFSDGRPMDGSDFPTTRALAEQQTIHDVVVGVVKEDTTTVWTSVSAAPLPGPNSGVVTVTADITERKRAAEQAFALAAEQQRVRLLREFITDVSHDIRTPLTMIGTTAFLVGKTTDPAKLMQYSQRLEEQISRLGLLLDNFVELAHVEEQASLYQSQPTDLDVLVKIIIERRKPEVAAKQQCLEYRCETDAAQVLGDPTALIKAIANVIVNAIHYTPDEGNITLRLYCEGENAIIEVADTGIGIRPVDLPHIFESFYRVDTARSTKSGGAGLGLTIAKKIITLMKGQIEVESEFGTGSVFKIYLPIYR